MGTRGDVLKFVLVLVAVLTPTARSACPSCRSNLACKNEKIDLTFLVDGSGSICGDVVTGSCANWITIKEFIVKIISYLNVGPDQDRVGFIQFANVAKLEFSLGQYNNVPDLINAIGSINHMSGNTNSSSAFWLLRQQPSRAVATKVAIFITDGISTYSPERTIPEAELVRNAGTHVYSIGVTEAIDVNEIRLTSMYPQSIGVSYFILPDFGNLKTMEIVEAVHDTVCVNYEINNKLKNCPGTSSQTGCYVLISTGLSKLSAQSECSRIAATNTPSVTGELVSVTNQAMQDEMTRMISALMKKGELSYTADIWLGATRANGHAVWRWVNSTASVIIGDQGCFIGRSGNLNDLNSATRFFDVSPSNCTAFCSDKGFAVTGVQNADRCLCGSVYGQFGGSSNCDKKCPGMTGSEGKCGGANDNNIYIEGGAYGEWSYEEPNNYNAEAGMCGVISGRWDTWKMASEICYKKKLYICQLNFDLTACRQASGSTTYRVIGNKCLFVSRDQSETGTKTWFDAQLECRTIGGELLTLDSAAEHEQLKTVMRDVGLSQELYWVGLLGKSHVWPSGERLSYNKWGPDQPSNSKTENCMVMTYSTQTQGFTWSAQDCNTALPSICKIDLTSPVTSDLTTVITTRTTIASTTTPYKTTNITNFSTPQATPATLASTNAPTGNFTDPNIGASTALGGGLGTVEIIVIAILCGLVLVGAIVGCIACAHHKKGKNKESMLVHPDKADYLKASVLTPYNTYYDKQQDYDYGSGVVMNPAQLTKTGSSEAEDHVYMKFNGGTGDARVTETRDTSRYSKRSEMYTDIPYHSNNQLQTTTQSFNMTSPDFGTRRMTSRDTSRMTISNDGRLINMNDE